MAAYIQVVLQESLINLGKSGDVVRVRPGYARNFLVPRKIAAYATARNLARLEHDKREALARAAKLKGEFETVAAKLRGVVVQLRRPVGVEGRMYGSVTAKDIAAALAHAGHTVDRRKVELPTTSIKALGTYEVTLRFASDVTATFQVDVVKGDGK